MNPKTTRKSLQIKAVRGPDPQANDYGPVRLRALFVLVASLILDDALGYTDPERLKLMGAVLAKAGRECQIIILTCVPDRYSNVGEATVVRLG